MTSVSAADGATGVAPAATFDETMDAATITTSTVQLSGPGGAVAASLSYDAATQRATLTPSSALVTSTTYTMTVQGVPTSS